MTWAIFSSPWEILIPSTAVSMEGKVESTSLERIPARNGWYGLGSKVSVWAIPPAIQRRMTRSAVALMGSLAAAPRSSRGAPAARADSVARLAFLRKSRRVGSALAIVLISVYQLEFRQHADGPEIILQGLGLD